MIMSVTSLLHATALAAVLLIFVLDSRAAGQSCSTFNSCSSCVKPRVIGSGPRRNCTWCIYAGSCMEVTQCLQYSIQARINHVEATTAAACPAIYAFKPNRLPKGKPSKISFRTNFPFVGQLQCQFSDLVHRTDVTGPTTVVARPVNNTQTAFTCSTPSVSHHTRDDVTTRVDFISHDHRSNVAVSGNTNLVFTTCVHPGCVPTPGSSSSSSTTPSTSHLPALTNPSRSRCIIAGGLDLVFNVANIRTTNHVTATFQHSGTSKTVDCRFFNQGSRLRCPIPLVQRVGTVSTVTVNAQVAVFRNLATITYDDVPRFNVQRHNHTLESNRPLLLEGVRIQSGGLTSNDYKVQVGSFICHEVSLTANALSCQPRGLSVTGPGEEYRITVTAGHFKVNVGSMSVRDAAAETETETVTETQTEEPKAEEASSSTTLAVSMGVVGILLVVLPGIALILVRRNGSLKPNDLVKPFQRRFKRRDSLQPLRLEVPASMSAVNQDVLEAGDPHQCGTSVSKDGQYMNQATSTGPIEKPYDDTKLAGVVGLKQDVPQLTSGEQPADEALYANHTRTTAPVDTDSGKLAGDVQVYQDVYS